MAEPAVMHQTVSSLSAFNLTCRYQAALLHLCSLCCVSRGGVASSPLLLCCRFIPASLSQMLGGTPWLALSAA